jgi:hypothetical protein
MSDATNVFLTDRNGQDVRFIMNQPVEVLGRTNAWHAGILTGWRCFAGGNGLKMTVRLANGDDISVPPNAIRPSKTLCVQLSGVNRVPVSINDQEPSLMDVCDMDGEDLLIDHTYWVRASNTAPWQLVEFVSLFYPAGESDAVYSAKSIQL